MNIGSLITEGFSLGIIGAIAVVIIMVALLLLAIILGAISIAVDDVRRRAKISRIRKERASKRGKDSPLPQMKTQRRGELHEEHD